MYKRSSRFLKSIGFKLIAESKQESATSKACIDIRHFPQPFFTQVP